MALTIEDLQDLHGLHGIIFGGITYYLTDSKIAGIGVGSGLFLYMRKFGHDIEPIKELLNVS